MRGKDLLLVIKSNLYRCILSPRWNREKYTPCVIGDTPCYDYYDPKLPYRFLYDGLFTDQYGKEHEFQVGVSSIPDTDVYDLHLTLNETKDMINFKFSSFDQALKKFNQLSFLRKLFIYIDDKDGNAVRVKYPLRPYAIVYNKK